MWNEGIHFSLEKKKKEDISPLNDSHISLEKKCFCGFCEMQGPGLTFWEFFYWKLLLIDSETNMY